MGGLSGMLMLKVWKSIWLKWIVEERCRKLKKMKIHGKMDDVQNRQRKQKAANYLGLPTLEIPNKRHFAFLIGLINLE